MERTERLFNVLIMAAGALVALESTMLLLSGHSFTSEAFGTIGPAALSLLAFQIIIFCAMAIAASALTFAPGMQMTERVQKAIRLASFMIGAILAVEGLASINVSFTLMGSIAVTSAKLIGIQLFCLGVLVMFGNMLSERPRGLTDPSPRLTALMFILLLFPSAFLIV